MGERWVQVLRRELSIKPTSRQVLAILVGFHVCAPGAPCPPPHPPPPALCSVTVSVSLGHLPQPHTCWAPWGARPQAETTGRSRMPPVPYGMLHPVLSTAHMPTLGSPRPYPRSQACGHLLRPLALGQPCPPEQQRPLEGQPPAGFLQGAPALLLGQHPRRGHQPQPMHCGPFRD